MDPKDPRSRLVARAAALKEGFADEDPTSKGLMLWLVLVQLEEVIEELAAVRKRQDEPVALPLKTRQVLERILYLIGGSVEPEEEQMSLVEILDRIEGELGTAPSTGSTIRTSGFGVRLVDVQRRLIELKAVLDDLGPKVTMLVSRSEPTASGPTGPAAAASQQPQRHWFTVLGIVVCCLGLGLAVFVGVAELENIDRQQPVAVLQDSALVADVRQAAAASTQAVAALEHLQARTKVVCKRWGQAVDAAGKLVADSTTGRPRYEGQDCESVIIPAPRSNPGPQPSR